MTPELDDNIWEKFLNIVRNADLSAPLDKDLHKEAKKALQCWD